MSQKPLILIKRKEEINHSSNLNNSKINNNLIFNNNNNKMLIINLNKRKLILCNPEQARSKEKGLIKLIKIISKNNSKLINPQLILSKTLLQNLMIRQNYNLIKKLIFLIMKFLIIKINHNKMIFFQIYQKIITKMIFLQILKV